MRRVLVLTLVISALLTAAGVSPSKADGDDHTTRLRFVLNHSADWAGISVEGGSLLAYHVAAASPGANVEQGNDGFDVKGPRPVSVTVDTVYWIPDGSSFTITLAKSLVGDARVIVSRTNLDPVQIADLSSTAHFGDARVSTRLSRSQIVGEGLDIPLLDPRRLVLSFYYPWFQQGSFNEGMWHDRPSDAYDTSDSAQVSRMVAQAAGAGVNGFIFSWDGQYDYPARFDLLLRTAEARGNFYAAPVIELTTFQQDGHFDIAKLESVIRSALQRASSPAFLRSSGRPVIFLFGAWQLGVSNWTAIKKYLAANNLNPFVVGDAIDDAFTFDGFYEYNPNGMSYGQLQEEYASATAALRLPAQVDPSAKQRLWAATVSPGENDFYMRPLNSTNEPRDGGARYDATWDVALQSQPEWVVITSWNEWFEATHIQPSDKYGTTALDQTRAWAAQFKNPASQAPASATDDSSSSLISRLMSPLSARA